MREKVGAGSRFAMVRGKVSRTIVRDTLRLLLRACGCGRARVGDVARAGGFRARRGISRAPPGGPSLASHSKDARVGRKLGTMVDLHCGFG